MRQNRQQLLKLTTVSLALGGFLGTTVSGGLVSACSMDNQTSNKGSYQQATSQANWQSSNNELELSMRSVLQEHAAITVPALKAELLQEPDRNAVMTAVEHNNMMVADVVESAYPGTKDEFLKLWRTHIGYYVDYLHATKDHDAAGQDIAKQNLVTFTNELSSWLADHNSAYDKTELKQMISTHGDQVTAIIDNLVAGNYDEVYKLAHDANEHMGMLADYLTQTVGNESSRQQHVTMMQKN